MRAPNGSFEAMRPTSMVCDALGPRCTGQSSNPRAHGERLCRVADEIGTARHVDDAFARAPSFAAIPSCAFYVLYAAACGTRNDGRKRQYR